MANIASRGAIAFAPRWCAVVHAGRWSGVLVAILVCLSTETFAQQYQADPVNDRVRPQGLAALNLVRNPAGYSAEKERFLEFFRDYYFPAMTRYGANDLSDLGKMRYELFSQFLWRTNNADMQKDLTDLAFEKMKGVVVSRQKNYHPAVRYNAILILGLLDEQYPIETNPNRRPSKPLREANALLTQVVAAAADGKAVDPSLLVGALVGLERHARFRDSLDRDAPAAMTAALLKLAAQEKIAPQADRQVSDWIRIQTATVLAKLGSPGQNGEVHSALLKMLAGEAEPKLLLDNRCQVALLLGQLNYQGATVDGQATAEAILALVDDVVSAEAKEAKGFEQLHLGGFAMGPPPKGRAKIDFETRQPVYDRRTLLARLGDVRTAVEKTKPIVPAEQQATFDAIVAAMRPVIDAAANKDEVDLQLAQKVRVMSDEIQRAVNPSATPVEDAGDVF